MGGLTYLFGFVLNAIIGAFLAVVAALIAAALPRRRLVGSGEQDGWSRPKRAFATFAVVWLGVMIYGCVGMSSTRHHHLSSSEAARRLPGLIDSIEQIISAEQIVHGDTAQTYVLIQTTAVDVERSAQLKKLKPFAYDAHTVADRGWPTPDWWPTKPCPGGISSNDDPWAEPPSLSDHVINWCPVEGRAYIQFFDW